MIGAYPWFERKTTLLFRGGHGVEHQIRRPGGSWAKNVQLSKTISLDHFGLPRYRNASRTKLGIER